MTRAATASPASSPTAIGSGEGWLLTRWAPGDLFVARPDGTDRRRVAFGSAADRRQATWAPDGMHVAYVVRDESASPTDQIWTAAIDGSGAAHLYGDVDHCNDGANWPAWAPDGRRLALVCYSKGGASGNGSTSISVLDTTTMHRTDLVTYEWPDFTDNPPSWSPDGTTLAFDVARWDATNDHFIADHIATLPATGGTMRRLTDPAAFGSHPDWSPDGRLIAFNTYDTGNMHQIPEASNVYLMAPDGSGLRRLTTASTDGKTRLGMPSWSADGSRLWVGVLRDFETDAEGWPKSSIGWVDPATGEVHELDLPGKAARQQPPVR